MNFYHVKNAQATYTLYSGTFIITLPPHYMACLLIVWLTHRSQSQQNLTTKLLLLFELIYGQQKRAASLTEQVETLDRNISIITGIHCINVLQ